MGGKEHKYHLCDVHWAVILQTMNYIIANNSNEFHQKEKETPLHIFTINFAEDVLRFELNQFDLAEIHFFE